MDKPLISVIIPVYNVEKYLDECIASVYEPDGGNKTEIILIDDGSTDNSAILCDNYGKAENIRVIHKANEGLSDARNTGLQTACGEYVFFIDADDFISRGAIKEITRYIMKTKCEICLFDASVLDNNGHIADESYYTHYGLEENRKYTGLECIEKQLVDHKDYPTTVWLGVYRRDYLISNGFRFKKGLLHEDELWTQKVLFNARSVYYLKKKLYCYRLRKGSITDICDKDNRKNISDLIFIFSDILNSIDDATENHQYRKLIKGNIIKRYLHMICVFEVWKYPDLDKKIDKQKILESAVCAKDRLRAVMLRISTRFYCMICRPK